MPRIKSSRRAAGLKPTDFDHTIDLVDHDATATNTAGDSTSALGRTSTDARLLPSSSVASQTLSQVQSPASSTSADAGDGSLQPQQSLPISLDGQQDVPHPAMRPSIETRAPSSDGLHTDTNVVPSHPKEERETAMDILYENERGTFWCGRPMFSSGLLGGLDPPAWTNAYHKPSPSDIYTAQVPDPSWEWVWSDWHINHQEGVDEGGWEYSFAFSNLFSWHGPRWHNSFVRRRAWTRKRAKKRVEDLSTDPHMINGDYFTVRPSRSSVMAKKLSRTKSPGSSIRPPSTMTVSSHGADDGEGADVEMDSIDTLLRTLRTAALDREKLEATIRYLDGEACDLDQLQDHMHDIMGNFVFQASRRLLLGHIMKLYSSVKEEVDGGDRGKETETEKGKEAETRTEKPELRARLHALEVALEHAEEEVRKLAYWSDVKEMADKGIRPRDARDKKDGSAPGHEWEGLDHSGPSEPNGGKLPGKLPEKSP